MRWIGLMLALGVLAVGQVATAKQLKCQASVHVLDTSQPGKQKARRNFSVRDTVDLTFEVRFRRSVSGEHLLKLDLHTPSGYLYKSISVPFARTPKVRRRRVPGYGRPVTVKKTKRRGGRDVISVQFPVAGTTIVRSGLYGTWTIEATLDETPLSLCSGGSFDIRE
jgi:hypothetical protein